jgi:UDP-GlcNAc:undecaprenyl-phosphate GlcNAc-1-phosphate transferase
VTGDLDLLVLAAIAFLAAALLSFALTPAARSIAHRVKAVDHPDERRVNTTPVPRGGGVAVGVAFLVVVAGLFAADALVGLWGPLDALARPEIVALLLGGAAAVAIGLVDDQFDLRARWQFGGQLLVALIPVGLGITVGVIANPFGPGAIRLEGIWGAIFVVVWTVGMINSINFIDGLDGLSSGVALIAAVTLGIISVTGVATEPVVALVCLILAGAILGFLRWNFHPASVFIGTSGVMFLGYTLALLSILGSAKVAVALLVLGVPIITSTTDCWTWASATPRRSCSSTRSASASGSSRSSCRGAGSCTRSWAPSWSSASSSSSWTGWSRTGPTMSPGQMTGDPAGAERGTLAGASPMAWPG